MNTNSPLKTPLAWTILIKPAGQEQEQGRRPSSSEANCHALDHTVHDTSHITLISFSICTLSFCHSNILFLEYANHINLGKMCAVLITSAF